MSKRSKCKRCGMAITEMYLIDGRGKRSRAWLAPIKGQLTEACPASVLLAKRHKPE